MLGKQKCKILKEIRQRIADENDIPYVTRECGFKGECRGTCPRCESELRYLERQLALRASLGKKVAVAALCAGMAFGASACAPLGPELGSGPDDIAGGMSYIGPTSTPEIFVTEGEVAWTEDEGAPADSTEIEAGEALPESFELTGDVMYAVPNEDSSADPDGDCHA